MSPKTVKQILILLKNNICVPKILPSGKRQEDEKEKARKRKGSSKRNKARHEDTEI